MVRRCRREVSGEDKSRQAYGAGPVATCLARLTEARVGLGDPKGLDDYADFLRSVDPGKVQDSLILLFAPMEAHPHHPATAAAAGWMFNDKASPWLPFLGGADYPNAWFHRQQLIGGPMVGVAGFRKLLLRSLEDRAGFGKVTVDEQGNVSVRLANGGSSGGGTAYLDPDGPKPAAESPIRVCDYFAWKLTGALDGIPPCMLYWPEDQRDRAEAAQGEFLRRYGERFAESPLYDQVPDRPGASRYPPVFAPLDHPATEGDVRDGLAVFSLEGKGETRLVRLAERPLAAKWVTLKEYGFRQQSFDPRTNETEFRTAYDQDGLVWQAEEVREGDRWRRYYGFVGRRMDRVPAEEIEFPAPWFRFGALSQRLECQVTTPPPPAEAAFPEGPSYEVGRPLTVGIRLRNRGGLDRSVPTEFARDRDGVSEVRRGVDLKLSRAAADATNSRNPAFGLPGNLKFEPLTPRPVARFTPGKAERTLGPGESFEAARLDLNTWYRIDRPGVYRLEVTFGPDSDVAEGSSNSVTFRVTPAPSR